MTTAQVVEMYNSPILDYDYKDNHASPTYEVTPGFIPLTVLLYNVKCNSRLYQAVLYSTKLHEHQGTWLPCEVEALSIATSVKHFSPLIIQSKNCSCVVTDSQPSVQVINKLCGGEFSANPALRLS